MRCLYLLIPCLLLVSSCRQELPWDGELLRLPIDAEDQLRDLLLLPNQDLMVVGGKRFETYLCLRSQDQGQTWTPIPRNPEFDKMVFSLRWQDSLRGYATAMDGKVLHTQNGGLDWWVRDMPLGYPMHGVWPVNDSVVVAVGGNGYSKGIIVRTEDRAQTWQPVDTLDFELRDVVFVDERKGFACGYGSILQTLDAGLTWTYTSAEREFFCSMDFPSPTTGYAVGRTGSILKTMDGGNTWTFLRNGNSPLRTFRAFNQVAFWDENQGYIIGDKGYMSLTQDGGNTWTLLDHGTKVDLHGLWLTSARDGWICGSEGYLSSFYLRE